jgi:uncharacterized protein
MKVGVSTSFDRSQISVWLASLGAVGRPSARSFDERLEELVESRRLLDEIYRVVARRPEAYDDARQVIDMVLARRHASIDALGEVLMSCLASGGHVSLQRAGNAAPPAEAAREDGGRPAEPPRDGVDAGEATNAPAPAPPVPEPLLPPDPVLLGELTRARDERRAGADEALGATERGMLATFLDLAKPPRDISTTMGVVDELDALEALGDTMERWPALPKSVQRHLLAMLVARVRAVKETGGLSPGLRLQVRHILALCPPYAKKNPMGAHVNGLQVAHVAQGVSWQADAHDLWNMLTAAVGKQSALRRAAGSPMTRKGHLVGGGSYIENGAQQFALSIIDLDAPEPEAELLPVGFLPHGLAIDPRDRHRAALFEKQGPGACIGDLRGARPNQVIRTSPRRRFYGHGAFSRDGALLYATESIVDRAFEGVLVVRDARTLRELGEVPTFGAAPHDCQLLDDGKTMVVTNGGGRLEGGALPSVTYVDLETRKLLERVPLGSPRFNAGHVVVTAAGDLAVVSAPRVGLPPTAVQLGALTLRPRGGATTTLEHPAEVVERMLGETLSVVVNEDDGVVLATHPLGDCVSMWRMADASCLGTIELSGPRGVAMSLDRAWYLVSHLAGRSVRVTAFSAATREAAGFHVDPSFTSGSHVSVLAILELVSCGPSCGLLTLPALTSLHALAASPGAPGAPSCVSSWYRGRCSPPTRRRSAGPRAARATRASATPTAACRAACRCSGPAAAWGSPSTER